VKQPSAIGAGLIRRGLKVSHLRLFAALVESGQMSAAANAIAISQPAASRLAAEAARITGAKLYERTSRGVELTPAGLAFARRARTTLFEIDETEREIHEIGQGYAGHVNIGAVTGPSIEYALPAVRQARLSMPRVSVNIEVATSDILGEALYRGDLDFYVGRILGTRDKRLFSAHTIGPEPISLIVRRGHPLLRTPDRIRGRLSEFDWVLPFEKVLLRTAVESSLTARGIPLPEKVLSTSSFMLTIVTITQTNAIAPVAKAVVDYFASELGDTSPIVELPAGLNLLVEPYALIKMAGHRLTPAAQALYDIVAGEIGRHRANMEDDIPQFEKIV
jgi:DNA-binding transcriptional LysR family regulator